MLVVIVVLLLTRGGGLGGSKEPPIPTLKFVAKTKVVAQAKPPAAGAHQAEVDEITEMFNDYYQEAFVDPGKWGDGTFEDLADLFADDVKASFKRDLPSMTIGEARTELKRVDLGNNFFGVTVYYDSKQKPTYAVTTVQFNATGTLKKAGPKVTIKQTATYWLQKAGSGWKITAYDTNETQTTPTPSPTASAT